jgi:hypothetical protein
MQHTSTLLALRPASNKSNWYNTKATVVRAGRTRTDYVHQFQSCTAALSSPRNSY